MPIPLKRLDPDLPMPRRAHTGDGGVDLHARESVRLQPGEWRAVPTGVAVAIPEGYAGLVTPRSGLAARSGIGVVNGPGLVDSGYRGEIMVILINQSPNPVEMNRGDRIAQLVVVPVSTEDFVEVEDLSETSRGAGGLGSTGS